MGIRKLIVVSAFAIAAAALSSNASAQFLHSTDMPGLDYRSFDLSGDAGKCRDTCVAEARCAAWTWVKPGVQGPSARCWLKTAVPQARANPCCISGPRGGKID